MTNLIAKVAELRELEARAEPEWRKGKDGNIYCKKSDRYPLLMPYGINANSAEGQLTVDLRNSAPKLLTALGKIQAGDSEVFDALIDYLESNHGGTEYEEMELSVMRRYADLARLMEDSP